MSEQPVNKIVLTIANGEALTAAFPMHEWVSGLVIVPAAWTDANIGFKICDTQSGTFVALKDETGSPVQISSITTNASYAYKIPTAIFPATWVKLWSKSTTAATVTDTNQGAERSLTVQLK